MKPVLVRCDVEVDDVSILKWPRVRDAMADDFIDRRAAAAGEVVVVAWRRVGALRDDVVMNDLVDLLSCHTWRDNRMAGVEGLSGDAAHAPQLLQIVVIRHRHRLVSQRLEVLVWRAGCCVIGLLDVVGDRSQALERVREWAQRTCEGSRRLPRLVHCGLLVRQLVELPEASEALLATEERGRQAQLNAGRTLHRGRVRTVRSCARFESWLRWHVSLNAFLLLAGVCLHHLRLFFIKLIHSLCRTLK